MEIKKPNVILYSIVYILFYPILKIYFGLKVDRKGYDPPKGPFLVIANHATIKDFLIVMLSLYPRLLNAVTAYKYFYQRPLNKFLPVMGCIPKNQFDRDIRAIFAIKAILKRGDRVLMFPEGRCSIDGAFAGINKTTGKLVKNLGVPVISCYIEGAYTCMPHWRKGFRAGRERITISRLFSEEETKTLTADEINEAIVTRLNGVDTPPPKKPVRTLSARRLAEGLHNILYWCPKCGSEFKMETKGNTIHCTSCGNSAVIDRTAALTPTTGSVMPDSIHGWFGAQAQYETQFLHEDMKPIVLRVKVRVPSDIPKGEMTHGEGTLRLDPKGWHYDGTLAGEDAALFFPIDTVPAAPCDYNDNFQIYSEGRFYKFTPEDSKKCLKYSLIGECAHKRFATRNTLITTPAPYQTP